MTSPLIPPPPPPRAADVPALPPIQNELPYDDGVPMETLRHQFQMDLLIELMDLWLEARAKQSQDLPRSAH